MKNKLLDLLYKRIGHNLYFDLTDQQLNQITIAMMDAIEEDRQNVAKNARVLSDPILNRDGYLSHYGNHRVDINSIIYAPHIKLK